MVNSINFNPFNIQSSNPWNNQSNTNSWTQRKPEEIDGQNTTGATSRVSFGHNPQKVQGVQAGEDNNVSKFNWRNLNNINCELQPECRTAQVGQNIWELA